MPEQGLPEKNFRVSLRDSTRSSSMVVFHATPDLIETRNVNYKAVDLIHAPGQVQAYQNTSSRSFNMSNIRLVSRTPVEAENNLRRLWLLRAWTMPYFGRSTLSTEQRGNRLTGEEWFEFFDAQDRENILGTELRGKPPSVLLLSAYNTDSMRGSKMGHINRVPVVIQNLSIPYPSDVDYIPTAENKIPMPVIMTLDMTLLETHSPREYEKFSLYHYREGILPGF